MIKYNIFETRFGYCAIASDNDVLCRVVVPGKTIKETQARIMAGINDSVVEERNMLPDVRDMLISYFDGNRVDFSDIKVNINSKGKFHIDVYKAAQKISYGTIVSYKHLAELAGNSKAARAVGQAMANNQIPIVIPCHRVVTSSNKLGGFAYGLDCKTKLLEMEGIYLK